MLTNIQKEKQLQVKLRVLIMIYQLLINTDGRAPVNN